MPTKAELIEEAQRLGLHADDGMTKGDIQASIDAAHFQEKVKAEELNEKVDPPSLPPDSPPGPKDVVGYTPDPDEYKRALMDRATELGLGVNMMMQIGELEKMIAKAEELNEKAEQQTRERAEGKLSARNRRRLELKGEPEEVEELDDDDDEDV